MSAYSSAAALLERVPGWSPRVGIILGSGLGDFAEKLDGAVTIPYADLPGFPEPTVHGHVGTLVAGTVAGVPVACLRGRRHAYEGGDTGEYIRVMIRTLKLVGVKILLLTNAAGSLMPDVPPGSIVAVSDHINMLGFNPLTGPNDDRFGPRFPSVKDAYDPALRRRLHDIAAAENLPLAEGVYLGYGGPSFESPAEIRAFRIMGADLVGMSTVPEVIVARHCGLRVACLSVVTNMAEGMVETAASHDETIAVATQAAGALERLITRFIGACGDAE